MKKITIAVCLLSTLYSCHPSGSTTVTPSVTTSTCNITFNGKTYNVSVTGTVPGNTITANTQNLNNVFVFGLRSLDLNKVDVTISAHKYDISTALGTYITGYSISNTPILVGCYITVTDYGDGGKVYSGTSDSLSTVNVSLSNGSEVKGTFNVNLLYNGATYPATGDFDYKH
ncbi:hypothetical protein CJD36_019210 [Flavipsychrobacter stenotrophus]|uniref:Lipocalin-like domain-containing protein n=1 Tax=Flavipsychrobacter stenotrophus TaxID=2077091 RepID=A0A2S7SRN6_9BACT|nr:hypothetical protein [Flavipsychrobacter stenotrophus]PQJ09378.1 hypothetical protein CJD36_019210 [Flavipsychrobacter stenotrophus]